MSSIQHVYGVQSVSAVAGHGNGHAAAAKTLTVKEAASLLGVSEGKVLKLIDEQVLCAELDSQTYSWLVDAACAEMHIGSEALSVEAPAPIEVEEVTDASAQHQLDALTAYTGIIDMEPPEAEWQDTEIPWASVLEIKQKPFVRGLDREAITQHNVEAVIESLDSATVRLEGAMYRIGYLEAQVDGLQEQLSVLPEYRTRAARAIISERENAILKQAVEAKETELAVAKSAIERLQSHFLWPILSWLCGIAIEPSANK